MREYFLQGPEQPNWPEVSETLRNSTLFKEASYILVRDINILFEFARSDIFDYYEVLNVSAVIRRLLFDEKPLARKLAKAIGLKMFVVRYPFEGERTTLTTAEIPDYCQFTMRRPEKRGEGSVRESIVRVLKLDDYFKEQIGVSGGHPITPKLAVKFAANKLGGVHYDSSFLGRENDKKVKYPEEEHINKIYSDMYHSDKSFAIFGKPSIYYHLRTIAADVFYCASPLGLALVHAGVVSKDELPRGAA